ncbi:hypothetical protein L6164_006351 [Bauhinia variegata]|uniref:Uncharacterized protein n=1 Tax=Bauhinia variegata TaxID=167791 RepID=A0ACB9PUQ7_BAUVA|nr:hypothetical protein L6164_006351 [Bauhinia variegata]
MPSAYGVPRGSMEAIQVAAVATVLTEKRRLNAKRYELQLVPRVQGERLGKFLLQLIELIAHKVLTLFLANFDVNDNGAVSLCSKGSN